MYWNQGKIVGYMLKYIRLTLTWDVLKFSIGSSSASFLRLTLTWDVLKCFINRHAH